MSHPTIATTCVNVAGRQPIWVMLCALLVGCNEHERPRFYQLGDAGAHAMQPSTCDDRPSEGCPCDVPGTLVDCGEVRDRTNDYVTCMQGVRLCGDEHTWGACAGNLVKQSVVSSRRKSILTLGTQQSCTDINPCDPLCRQIIDTGAGLTGLPEGMCSTATGVGPCPLCGYAGPIGDLPYASFPSDWQRVPASCSPATDNCPFDMVCVDSSCRTRATPCTSSTSGCSVDLSLGKPCLDPSAPNSSYHIPLCNRGTTAVTGASIQIGVDSRSATVTSCMPLADLSGVEGFPDSGVIEFQLVDGQSIEAGRCVDVNPTNSYATAALDLGGARAFLANFDGSVAECNACNNGSVAVGASDAGATSVCTAACVDLECNQTNAATALRGIVYDPAGRRPVPNAVVFVPNGTVAPFVDGVACDSCDSLVSGTPIAWTKTDATGHFTLLEVPSDTSFPLVVQLGRWRRQVAVDPIATGQTRWITYCALASSHCYLTSDATEPAPYNDTSRRLRLPATQRRCNSVSCAGEGDIPKMAVVLGEADPVQCVLRRIGIADSEFTCSESGGRVQLFGASGMRRLGAGPAFGPTGLLTQQLATGDLALNGYSLLLAPCDTHHATSNGENFADSVYGSGPSYNSWPDPQTTALERTNVKRFVDAGGRLLTTHGLSIDLVHLNYEPPQRAKFVDSADQVSLFSAFDPNSDSNFAAALSQYETSTLAGFDWQYNGVDSYNPNAPALYQFGINVEAGSNDLDIRPTTPTDKYPAIAYDIDQSTTLGELLASWASVVGASSGAAQRVSWQNWSPLVRDVRPTRGVVSLLSGDSNDALRFPAAGTDPNAMRVTPVAQEPCVQGDSTGYGCELGRTWGGEHVAMYEFDTPLDAAQKCGRVAVAAGHVSRFECYAPRNTRAQKYCGNLPPYSANRPPPDCDCLDMYNSAITGCGWGWDMSPEELSFEFLLFSASQCIGELKRPPAAGALATNVFVRDFEADCGQGEQAVWQLFSWQAAVPAGARIEMYGSTADAQEQLAAAEFVDIGVADTTTTTWTASNHTVDDVLRTQPTPPEVSRRWLRVKFVFVPNGKVAPVLSQWRVVYNCLQNE
jgi:hypothetical protein